MWSRFDFENQSPSELEADILAFEHLSASKAGFFDSVVANQISASTINPKDLRQETIFMISEFYYLLKVFHINDPQSLRRFAIIHNEKIEQLKKNKEQQQILGVVPQRLQDATFDSDEKLERLLINSGTEMIRLSQSDLARFMIEYMSPETCRNGVKILADSGYLTLTRSPFGAVLVTSAGTLEELYANYIRNIRKAINTIETRDIENTHAR